ncbi:MAG: AI-2E family transporter [Oscillochloridaceae bacterium]|nr:AI-2E family transporter [Chloroflexaceae bacterium]MDW8390759.1 AI-2E family transporter [Oscillochloridaceae bacterium]
MLQITARTWFALFGLGVALILVGPLLPLIRSVALLLFLAALLSMLLYPLVTRLGRRGVPGGLTVAGALTLIVVLFLYLGLQMMPLFATALDGLSRLLVAIALRLEAGVVQLPLTTILNTVSGLMGGVSSALIGAAAQVGALFWTLFVLVVLVFTLVTSSGTRLWLLHFFVPAAYRPRVVSLLGAVSEGLSRWFMAQLAISGYYIIGYGIAGLVVGIPFAIPIAVISGLLEFIPYLGGLVGLGLAVLAASTVSQSAVVWIVIAEAIIGMIAVYVVVPFFFARAIKVPPGAVLFGLYVGGLIGGFFAALLTVPVVTIITILIRELRPVNIPAEGSSPDS